MKGVTYNLIFTPPSGDEIKLNKINMANITPKIRELIKDHYKLDIPVSKYMIYNLITRPNYVSKLLKQIINVKPN